MTLSYSYFPMPIIDRLRALAFSARSPGLMSLAGHSQIQGVRTRVPFNRSRFIRNYCARHHMCQLNNLAGSASAPHREVLPTNVKPLKYTLSFEPDFTNFTFAGTETIELAVNDLSDSITLNSTEITIHDANVSDVPVKSIDYDEKGQTATFHLADTLTEGSIVHLNINFSGILNDKMAGFYRSSYNDNGTTKYLATTQMEPTDCRRAFPSFDEPALKAKFDISLIADRNLVCLSNMNEKSTTLLDHDRKKVTFNTTPLMSTYLVAFVIGDLKYVENNSYRVPIKVYATPGSEHLGQYAADITAKTLVFFDKKFDIPYPLPKCDLVAIPDFSAGAMENFGLITFRNADLLINPKETDVTMLTRVTEVVMHELAHQWFGNLVTMDFWDGLWLNEGFATWMSWFACNSLYPEWKVWESYVSDTLQGAMNLDALRSSHPVEVPVQRADQINQIFDNISYSKGSSLLKMIADWLGEDVFIKGVSNYLKKHKWGNTQTSDLWASLSEASGEDVVKVMDIWTKKVGYPIIDVKEDGKKITVTQNRYLTSADVKPEEDEVLYPVFLNVKTSEGTDRSLVLDTRSKTFDLSTSDDFFKLNSGQTGIYRTSYDQTRWAKLGKAPEKLSVEDRVGLVADARALSVSGYIPTTDLLNLVRSWTDEKNYVVWDTILGSVSSVRSAFKNVSDEVDDALKAFTRELISKQLLQVGWDFKDTDSFTEQQLKQSLFSSASAADQEEVVADCQKAFKDYVAGNKNAIHPNSRSSVFTVVAKKGGKEEFDQLYKIYLNPLSAEEKLAALRVLGRVPDKELRAKLLDLSLKSDVIKQQDMLYAMVGCTVDKDAASQLWQWFTVNWDKIYKILPPGLSMLGSAVSVAIRGLGTASDKENVESFFKNKDTAGFDQALAQSLEALNSKIAWVERDSQAIKEWISTNGYK